MRTFLCFLCLLLAACGVGGSTPPPATPTMAVALPSLTATGAPASPSPGMESTPTATNVVGAAPTAAATPPAPAVGPATPSPAPADPLSAHLEVLHPEQVAPDLAQLPHYVIRGTLEPPRLQGEIVLTLPNTFGVTLNDVLLRLYGNGRTIYTGSRMEVGEVRVNGQPVAAAEELGGTGLRVPLPTRLPPGEHAMLEMTFETVLASGPQGGYGIQQVSGDRAIFGSPFPLLPLWRDGGWAVTEIPVVGDAVSSPVAIWDIELTVPEGLTVVSTGRSERIDGGRLRILSGPARDVALVSLPRAVTPIEREVAGMRLRYWPESAGAAVSANDAATIAAAALRAFDSEFGPAPYAEIDVVEAAVPIGGYEYPGLVLFDGAERMAGDVAAIDFLLPHELAHQWFYALVGNSVTAEPWIDEGLATFAALRYLAEFRGDEAAAARRATWEREYAGVLARTPVGVDRPVYGYGNWVDYRGPTYYAGALLFDDLRLTLGEAAFWDGMTQLVSTYRFSEMSTNDVQVLFDGVAAEQGIDLTAFWQRWLADP